MLHTLLTAYNAVPEAAWLAVVTPVTIWTLNRFKKWIDEGTAQNKFKKRLLLNSVTAFLAVGWASLSSIAQTIPDASFLAILSKSAVITTVVKITYDTLYTRQIKAAEPNELPAVEDPSLHPTELSI
jgi:hypothetical protein